MTENEHDRLLSILKSIFSSPEIVADKEEYGVTGFASFVRKIHLVDKDIFLFSKASYSDRHELGELQEYSRFFCRNEIFFYGFIIPIINSVCDRYGLLKVVPEVHYSEITDSGTVLVMEDLTQQGYEMKKHEDLSKDEIHAIFKSTAHLNAAFWIARDSFNFMLDSTLAKGSKFESNFADSGLPFHRSLEIGYASLEEFFDKNLTAKEASVLCDFYSLRQELCAKTFMSGKCKRQKLLGLSHGDFWFGNVFMKHQGGEIVCKIFDWQFWCVNSMVDDFGLTLITSTTSDIIVICFDEFVERYFNTFRSLVEEATGKAASMSLEEFREGCLDSLLRALLWIVGAAVALLRPGNPVDLKKLLKTAVRVIEHFDLKNREF